MQVADVCAVSAGVTTDVAYTYAGNAEWIGTATMTTTYFMPEGVAVFWRVCQPL